MHESKEKSTHKLPMLLSKTKHGDTDDIEDGDEAENQAKEEFGDNTEVD